MTIFVDAARLIINLVGLTSQFGNAEGFGANFGRGEYLASSVTSMSADGIAFGLAAKKQVNIIKAYRAGCSKRQIEQAMKQGSAKYKGASMIIWTLATVDILELTTGFGPPSEGNELIDGSKEFTAASGQLESALPGAGWGGSASQAYAGGVTTLQSLAEKAAELDLQLAALVKDQADLVTHIRLGFGILKGLLLAAYAIEILMRPAPAPAGPVASLKFATTVSSLGIAAALGMMTTLAVYSHKNADKADVLTGEYQKLAGSALPSGKLRTTEVPAATESTVSNFAGCMSGVSAMPDIATLARLAPGDASAQQRAPLDALTSEGETPGHGMGEETPDRMTPFTRVFTISTPTQATQLPGGHAARIVPTVQQGQKSAVPAEDPASADDVDRAEAASGTEGSERAPIELALVGATQVQEPSPVQRIAWSN